MKEKNHTGKDKYIVKAVSKSATLKVNLKIKRQK